MRLRYDWEISDQKPKFVVDKGRLERNGITLLKSRKRMRRGMAIELWNDHLAGGWQRIKPEWEYLRIRRGKGE